MPILLVPGFVGSPKVVPIPRVVSAHFPQLQLKSFVYSTQFVQGSAVNLAPGASLAIAVASGSVYNYYNLTFGVESLGTATTPFLRVELRNGVPVVATFDLPAVVDRDNGLQNFVFVTDFTSTILTVTNLTASNMTISMYVGNTSSPGENVNDFEFKGLINAKIANNTQANNVGKIVPDVGPNVTP